MIEKTIYIVGGGNSLKNFDFKRLKGKNIIAINRAIEFVPFAQILYFADYRFYRWHKEQIDNFNGAKFTSSARVKDESITVLELTGKTGLDTRLGRIRGGGSSGYGAINLAFHLGATKIVLLGYDMQKDNKSNFHSGYKTDDVKEDTFKKFLEPYTDLAVELNYLDIRVYNANLKSGLNVFEKVSIDVFLK